YARAHLMGETMRLIGVETGKVWALPGVEGPHFAGEAWDYHVAPAVQVQLVGSVETRVIDPPVVTTTNARLSTRDWMSTIGLEHHLAFSSPLTPAGLAAARALCVAGEQAFHASGGSPSLAA